MTEPANLKGLEDDLKAYVHIQTEILRLSVADKASTFGAMTVTRIVLSAYAMLCIIFLSAGLALFIGQRLESFAGGFLIVGAFYLLVLAIVYAIRHRAIAVPVKDAIIRDMLAEEKS